MLSGPGAAVFVGLGRAGQGLLLPYVVRLLRVLVGRGGGPERMPAMNDRGYRLVSPK